MSLARSGLDFLDYEQDRGSERQGKRHRPLRETLTETGDGDREDPDP